MTLKLDRIQTLTMVKQCTLLDEYWMQKRLPQYCSCNGVELNFANATVHEISHMALKFNRNQAFLMDKQCTMYVHYDFNQSH